MENHFDYQKWLKLKRDIGDESIKRSIASYEKGIGSLDTAIEETFFYKSYLSNFNRSIEFDLPLFDKFDFDLFLKLVFASQSSEWKMDAPVIKGHEISKCGLIIIVSHGDVSFEKNILELDSSQILRLFDIYISEQINFSILEYEESQQTLGNQNSSKIVVAHRKKRLNRFLAAVKSHNSFKEVLKSLLLMGFKS